MRVILIYALAAVLAALIAGRALPVFAQESSGGYTTLLGAQQFGTESYTVRTNPDGTRRTEADVSFGGAKFRAVTVVGADGRPASFATEVNGAPVTTQEYTAAGAKVRAGGQPEKTVDARPAALLENGIWHHFIFLLAQYDASRGGAQEFAAFLPSGALPFGLTLERDSEPSYDVKGRRVRTEHYRARTTLGLDFEIWADSSRTPILISVPAQDVRAVRHGEEDLAAVILPPRAAAAPSADDPYTSEEVTFANGEQKLVGTLTVPKGGAAPHPAAVIITGSGPQDRDGTGVADIYRRIAEALSAAGVAVLRVDDRGAGKSSVPTKAPSYRDLIADSRAAFEYLLARPEIDKARIALVGHSEGADTALIIAAEDARVAAVALLAGASQPIDRVLIEQSLFQASLAGPVDPADRTKVSPVVRQLAETFEKARSEPAPPAGADDKLAWFREHIAHDPLATARKVRAPVLVANGERDALVLPHHALALAQALTEAGNRRVTLRVFPNLTHVFTPVTADAAKGERAAEVSQDFLKALREWTAATLSKSKQ